MVVGRGLLIKGLGVCALCAGGTAVALKWRDIRGLVSSEKKRVWGGLECEEPSEEKGGNCVLGRGEEGKIFVKKGSEASFEVSNLGEGKIKVYKVEGGENAYSENFKFLIEDNDISGVGENKKLEEFESYEIKLGGSDDGDLNGKHYLSRKTEAKKEIKNALGLPWELQDSSTEQQNINTENLKGIKFSGGEASITGGTVTLTISKETTKTDYPLGYKFSFKNTNNTADATLKVGDKTITLKKDSPVDFKIKKEGTSLSLEKAWTLEELAEKVGLVKEADGYWFVGKTGMNVKLDESTKKTKSPKYYDPKGRVKVYENESGYNEGLRFTIEKGDLDLNDTSGERTKSYTLGQFQSFEIVKDSDGTWYFTKKEGEEAKVKEALGLPCELPTGNDTSKECNLTNENIKTIKFDGLGSGSTASYSGTPKLTIYKESERTYFPLGYKFTFSSTDESTITIPSATPASITLKSGLSVDYKVKRSGENNQTITLEKAWTPESLMEGPAGFAKSSKENGWTEEGDYGIAIKQDSLTDPGAKINKSNNSAKIKVYEEVPGYSQGYKFMVEEGDMNLSDGDKVNKLSKYETYEVVKDSEGGYYFTRKKKSEESIRELLGIPDTCAMPTAVGTPKECDIDSTKINGIKFDGKGSTQATITDGGSSVKLKISKETGNSDFPLGYKFTFSSTEHGFTVPLTTPSSSTLSVKKNTNTEFKIKETGSTLTLEKVWDVNKLAAKIGLSSCTENEKKCNLGATISVWDAENNYVDGASVTDHSSKKISYELDQDGYNQGIKFTVDGENDIDLTTTNATGSESKPDKINKKDNGNGPTYQIMEKTTSGNTTKWYLVKKGG